MAEKVVTYERDKSLDKFDGDLHSRVEVKFAIGRQIRIERETDPLNSERIMRFAPVLGRENLLWVIEHARHQIQQSTKCGLIARGIVDALKRMGGNPDKAEKALSNIEAELIEVFGSFGPGDYDPDAFLAEHERVTRGLGVAGTDALDDAIFSLAERAAELARAPIPEPSKVEQA